MLKPFNNSNADTKEFKNVINLMQNNVDNTKDIINQIDIFLETKVLPKSMLDILTTQRNTYAVNVMNSIRIMKRI
ncbi:hypothetical protein SAMN04487910_3326 [Aquimarina amphilecti]|uniref:Uncharacterized protein n=1 Tax=Aquimarina amphilecti TaxID=1038014 RepID=A0A1H7T882_AQUAM|nr:hypothetical protein [Aquimarina amphilecti]SEL81101.1 hypothetical protein SAMN04487910_3326 [Aquimarina amphilecti]